LESRNFRTNVGEQTKTKHKNKEQRDIFVVNDENGKNKCVVHMYSESPRNMNRQQNK